jgi:DNA-binding CsgD family transcriptional regulator
MLVDRAATLEKIQDVDMLWHAVVETLACIGFEHAIYLTVTNSFESPLLRCTMVGLYDESPPQDDPFLRYSCDNYDIIPIGAEFVDGHPYITDRERAFIDRASAKGFRSGLAIPMRLQGSGRFGGFIIGTSLDRVTFMDRVMPRAEEIRLFCLLIHRRVEDLTSPQQQLEAYDFRSPLIAPRLPAVLDQLTPREREIIYLISRGRSRKEAARMCSISIHTVSDYAKSAYRKLGVRNRAQAAALINMPGSPLDE